MEQPERLARPESTARASGNSTSGLIGLARMALPALFVGLALYLFVLPTTYVTQKADKANHDGLVTLVNGVQAQVKGDQGTLATLSTQITALSKQVQDSQSSVNSMSSAVSKITGIQQSIDSLSAKVNGLPASQPDINPLKTQLASLQSSLDAVKADVAVLKTGPTVPVANPPTVTSLNPNTGASGTSVVITGTNFNAASSVTFGGISAQSFVVNSATQITAVVGTGATGSVGVVTPAGAVSSLSFTYTGTTATGTVTVSNVGNIIGQPYVLLNPMTTNNSSSPSFVFTLNNNTGKSITNVQLAVIIQCFGSATGGDVVDVPTGTTIKVTSPSLIGTAWQGQVIGGGVYVFLNQVVTSGVLAGIGTITQNVGSAQYNVSISVTTTTNAITSPIYIYPMVKVQNYQ